MFTQHMLEHKYKLECTIAPCFQYQIKSSEKKALSPVITVDSPHLRSLVNDENSVHFSGLIKPTITFSGKWYTVEIQDI